MRLTGSLMFVACISMIGAVRPHGQPATAPATKPATLAAIDPHSDPRPGLAAFFSAVRKSDEAAAFDCWFDDIKSDADQKYVENLVHYLIQEMIATVNYEAALHAKFPADFDKSRHSGDITPDTAQLLGCKYTSYRRLAICKWGESEDAGFPMVLDNHDIVHNKLGMWKLSMQQWYETTQSSVGGSMLSSGWGAKAKNRITKELLAGKFNDVEEMQTAYLKYLNEIADSAGK